MKTLKINPTFKDLIPPLSHDELHSLEESILSQGQCRDTIKIWRGIIIDGHNRYAICQKHGAQFQTQEMRFASKKDAELWIVQNQLGRRNLTNVMRIKLALHKQNLLREKAKKNRKGCQGVPVNTRKIVAGDAVVSERTLYKYLKVREIGTPELVQRMDAGKVKIGTAYNEAMDEAMRDASVACAQPEPDGLSTGLDVHLAYEVIARTVDVFTREGAADISNPYCLRGVLGNIARIERYCGFMGDNAGDLDGDDTRVVRRVGAQVRRVLGLRGGGTMF